jgi:hypothetical protein
MTTPLNEYLSMTYHKTIAKLRQKQQLRQTPLQELLTKKDIQTPKP